MLAVPLGIRSTAVRAIGEVVPAGTGCAPPGEPLDTRGTVPTHY